jgi:hypothetical protein
LTDLGIRTLPLGTILHRIEQYVRDAHFRYLHQS